MCAWMICVLTALCVANSFAAEEAGVITGVDLQLLLSDYDKAGVVFRTRELGSMPKFVFYNVTAGKNDATIGIAVFSDARRAEEEFSSEVSNVSVGPLQNMDGSSVDPIGDQSANWGASRSFRRGNVCVFVEDRGRDEDRCRALALFLDKALQQKPPRGANVPVPAVRVTLRKDGNAEVELEDESPVLLIGAHPRRAPVTSYSVIVAHLDKPLVMATRTNVVFEVAIPPLSIDSR